jgi:serpin B
MGMPDAFSPSAADFSGISGSRGLFISKVIHQAGVDLNEEGTEAAAATAVVMKRGGVRAFIANHPFLFLVRDRESGSILFLGRVVNPEAGSDA